MNLIILTNADLASNFALNLLLPELSNHRIKILISSKVGKPNQPSNRLPEPLKQLQFFEQTLINELLFPLIDRQTTPSNSRLKTFKKLETFLHQPIQPVVDINATQTISDCKNYHPDLIISIRFGLILKEEIIATAKNGVINLHSGHLPQYQGVMPTFRAMLNGDSEIGTCLHYISDRKIDSGKIIASTSMAILKQHCYLWHVLNLYQEGCKGIIQVVKNLENQQPIRSTKPHGNAQYFSFPNSAELQEFQAKGFKLIDTTEITAFTAQYLN